MSLAAEPYWDKAAYSWGAFSGKRGTSTCVHLGLGPGAEPKPLRDKYQLILRQWYLGSTAEVPPDSNPRTNFA